MPPTNNLPRPKATSTAEKLIIIVASIIGVIIAIPVITFILFVHAFSAGEDAANKQRPKDAVTVKAEAARYAFSAACTHSSQDSDVGDTNHTYELVVSYTCPATNWGALHDEVVNGLRQLGYHPEFDILVLPPTSGFYSTSSTSADLTYAGTCCRTTVSPSFINGEVTTKNMAEFRSQPLKSYTLTVAPMH